MTDDERDTTAARDAEVARKDREWAAGAPAAVGQSAPEPVGSSTGGGSAPGTYRTPGNLRPSKGPRFSGRGVLAVFGILGILVALGIMTLLAVKVFDSVSSTADTVPADVSRIDPGSEVDPGTQVDPGSEVAPEAPAERARAASCLIDHDTIETASNAYELAEGVKPSTIDELVAAGYLQPPDGGFSHELSQDGSIIGIGVCAGS